MHSISSESRKLREGGLLCLIKSHATVRQVPWSLLPIGAGHRVTVFALHQTRNSVYRYHSATIFKMARERWGLCHGHIFETQ